MITLMDGPRIRARSNCNPKIKLKFYTKVQLQLYFLREWVRVCLSTFRSSSSLDLHFKSSFHNGFSPPPRFFRWYKSQQMDRKSTTETPFRSVVLVSRPKQLSLAANVAPPPLYKFTATLILAVAQFSTRSVSL
jgi:hypothetical protein